MICIYICIYMYVCMYVCMYIYMFIYSPARRLIIETSASAACEADVSYADVC